MESGQGIPDIDETDIMFYFDILIYRKQNDEHETTKEYDAMGV